MQCLRQVGNDASKLSSKPSSSSQHRTENLQLQRLLLILFAPGSQYYTSIDFDSGIPALHQWKELRIKLYIQSWIQSAFSH